MTAQQHARRLKSREQFQAVLACAPVARTEHFVMHRMNVDQPDTPAVPVTASPFPGGCHWFGALVPKRWARRAVSRNLIKRKIYSLLTQQQQVLPLAAYVVRLRNSFDRKDFPSASSSALRLAVHGELLQLLSKTTRMTREAA